MKKLMIMLVLVFLMAGVAYSQIPVNMDKGDLAIAAGVNFGWDYGLGGIVEYVFARVDIADVVPVTFGLAVRGGVGIAYYLKPNIALYTSVIYVRYFDNTGGSSGFGSFGLILKL